MNDLDPAVIDASPNAIQGSCIQNLDPRCKSHGAFGVFELLYHILKCESNYTVRHPDYHQRVGVLAWVP